jgi:hypothetical protein
MVDVLLAEWMCWPRSRRNLRSVSRMLEMASVVFPVRQYGALGHSPLQTANGSQLELTLSDFYVVV